MPLNQNQKQTETYLYVMNHRRRQEDNIRIDIRETGWEGLDWMHLAQDRD
jgi:hypothetical protein